MVDEEGSSRSGKATWEMSWAVLKKRWALSVVVGEGLQMLTCDWTLALSWPLDSAASPGKGVDFECRLGIPV